MDLSHLLTDSSTPTTFTQANKSPTWRLVMSQEFDALQRQGTWTLVPLPTNQTALGCRWTFKTKLHSNGTVARHKARLVAQGFNQEHGLNYNETFSPVAKMPTLWLLLIVVAHNQWKVLQLDVSNTFLHGTLQETVYMRQPQGFIDKDHPNHVCHLQKAIYGLKQAPRA